MISANTKMKDRAVLPACANRLLIYCCHSVTFGEGEYCYQGWDKSLVESHRDEKGDEKPSNLKKTGNNSRGRRVRLKAPMKVSEPPAKTSGGAVDLIKDLNVIEGVGGLGQQ